MKDFDKAFVAAVKMLLREADEGEQKQKQEQKKATASQMVRWPSPGSGGWSGLIVGLKDEAGYEQVVQNTNASAGNNPAALMGRLGIKQPSDSKDPLTAAHSVLLQAIANADAMSEAYGAPVLAKGSLSVPINVAAEELSTRNATAILHLTLFGAYNAGMLKLENAIAFSKGDKEGRTVTITNA